MTFHDGEQGSFVLHAASNDDGPTAVRATGVDPARLVDGFFKVIDDLTHARAGCDLRPARSPGAGLRGWIPIGTGDLPVGARSAVRAAVLVEAGELLPARAGADRAADRGARRAGGLASAAGGGVVARGRGAGARRAAGGARPVAVGGARHAERLRAGDRSLRRLERGAAGGDAGGLDRHDGAAHRRIRHRQRSRSPASSIAHRRAAADRSSP